MVRNAVLRRRAEFVESICLNPIGWTLEEFKSRAKDAIPEHIYARILDQMNNCDLPMIELLVAGFDNGGWPHLFTIDWDGIPRVHDDLGFYAIGSGQRYALTMLFYRKATSVRAIDEALYFTFEAKAAGESAPGVGTDTDMHIFTPQGFIGGTVRKEEIDALRQIYDVLKPRDLDV